MDDLHYLESIKGDLLDRLLAHGYYRMGMFIFTTHRLEPNNDGVLHPVYWLRYDVTRVLLPAKNKQLLKKNEPFSVSVKPFALTPELEGLYEIYAASLPFKAAKTLQDNLQDVDNMIYDTHVIEVRDAGKLIATGVFDKGDKSIAGIINIYDPEYKKENSLGKFLMLMKYKYCLDNNIPYYYPGYYSSTYKVFDYKLFLDKKATEVYIPQLKAWIPYEMFCESIS